MAQDESKRTADPMVVLSAERTLLAWIRTGIALMAFGFVVTRFGVFLRELAVIGGHGDALQPDGAAIGLGVVAGGALVNVGASVRHHRMIRRLRQGATEIGTGGSVALGLATGICGIILIAVLTTVAR